MCTVVFVSTITTTKNTENYDASDGDYSVESDFTEILITDTMVDTDDDEMTIDLEDTNYCTPIKDDEISEDNEAAQEMDGNTGLHEEARESNEEIRSEETQSQRNHTMTMKL